ncbi:MAG: hypothetical protein V4596_11850 [Bdellovibrionota bacterium]
MNVLGFLARIALSSIIIFQLSIGTAFAAAGDGSRSAPASYAKTDQYLRTILNGIQQMEDGSFDKLEINPFHLLGQGVRFYKNGKVESEYSLDDPRLEKSIITPTNIIPRYEAQTKTLIFEYRRGALPDGTGGELIADHYIRNMDIVAMDYDKELLMTVDSKGNLHAIIMEFVIYEAFKNSIPVFENLWSSPSTLKLTSSETKAEFLTRGVKPPNAELDPAKTVAPVNEKGVPIYRAGDLYVRYMENGQEKELGLFSRDVTEKFIREGLDFILAIRPLVRGDKEFTEYYKRTQDQRENAIQLRADQIIAASKRMGGPIEHIEIDQLKRIGEKLSGLTASELKPRMADTFTLEEWEKDYEKIKNSATDAEKLEFLAKNAKHLQGSSGSDERKKIHRDLFNRWLIDAEAQKRLATPEGMAKGWQLFAEQDPRANPLAKPGTKPKPPKKIRSERAVEWAIIGAITTATAGYLSGAFIYDHYESLQQLKVVSWIYEHIYPAVMKDAVYRVPLAKSVFAWISIIPISIASSVAFGKAVDVLAAMNRNTNTAFGTYIREFQKTWGGHKEPFQRIVTAGLRAWSFLIYPYIREIIEKGLDQRVLLRAAENGINPFRRIKANSPEGQELGLQKNEFVGLIEPYLDEKNRAPVLESKQKIQTALHQQNKRLESLAWILATLAVSEKNQIDPATILQVSELRATPDQLKAVFDNPAKHREWKILMEEIESDLRSKNALTLQQEANSLSPDTIAEYYAAALDAVGKIRSSNELRQKAALRWKDVTTSPIRAANYMLLENGRKDALFLRSLSADKFISGQVKQEFISDHVWVTGLPAFYGGRADLNLPQNLTAEEGRFMWTSTGHNYDMVMNTKNHFFESGASLALVFQKLEVERESLYLPRESFTQASDPRPESLTRGAVNWLSYGYLEREKDIGREDKAEKSPGLAGTAVNYMYNLGTEANIGGLMVRRAWKRMTTLQAGITTALVFRGYLAGQDAETAMAAWALMFAFGQWAYGWPWDFIQRGNQMIEQRLSKNDGQFENAKYKIKVGFNESNLDLVNEGYIEMQKLYERYNPKALKQLKAILDLKLKNPVVKGSGLSEAEKEYIGIIAKLAKANFEENKTELASTVELLRKILVDKQGYDKAEVAKLNAESIIEFSMSNPPVYTHPNKLLSEFFTGIGAFSTTLFYIPLSIMLFDTESLLWNNIAKYGLASVGLYLGAWLTLGKTPWLYYEKIYVKVRERFKRKSEDKSISTTQTEIKIPTLIEKPVERDVPPKPRFVLSAKPSKGPALGGNCASLFN